jgi:hypothetical protein
MSDCCDTETDACCTTVNPNKRPCPDCGKEAGSVGPTTILHHLKSAWSYKLADQKYYFCDAANCEVVYFGEDGRVIGIKDIRGEIGQKRTDPERLLCYCFGVTQRDAQADPRARAFVVEQTRQGACACESRNPSGRCCLKDFPK